METRKILQNKTFLYATEFFAGMSVMAVELGASRLLAPYFSSSQIVWTIIIGTIMVAMALGNIYGGKAADKDPDPDRLYRRILIAAIWIAVIPVAGKYVILGISALMIVTISTNLLIWAALIACLVIFVFPLFLLGTVTPSLIKYSLDSLETSGSIAGRLGAFNTIGSIIGTFLPTFVTIPAVGASVTFLIFAGVLLALCIAYFMSRPEGGNGGGRRGTRGIAVGLIALILCSAFGHRDSFAFWEDDLVYEGESVYNYLQVKEDEKTIALSTNVLFGVQSIRNKDDALTGMYYDYALAAPCMAGRAEKEKVRVLVLGNGTGTYATQCTRYFDNVETEGVEIDGSIIRLAAQYFAQPDDAKVTEYDGRAFLNAVEGTYDVIMVDAFRDITIPFQMSSVEFFELVRAHLAEDGVMVVNLNMRGDEPGDINHHLCDTISAVFDSVCTVDVPYSTNRELFAANTGAARPDGTGAGEGAQELARRLRRGAADVQDASLSDLMEQVAATLTPYEAGDLILTDDKAPVEMLGMKQIDTIIRDEIGYYKEKILAGDFSF